MRRARRVVLGMRNILSAEALHLLDNQRLLHRILWVEALNCAVNRVVPTRDDGVLAILGNTIAMCRPHARA